MWEEMVVNSEDITVGDHYAHGGAPAYEVRRAEWNGSALVLELANGSKVYKVPGRLARVWRKVSG